MHAISLVKHCYLLSVCIVTLYVVGYQRVAIDVEFDVSSKKSAMPPAEDLRRVIEEATVPQGVCDTYIDCR